MPAPDLVGRGSDVLVDRARCVASPAARSAKTGAAIGYTLLEARLPAATRAAMSVGAPTAGAIRQAANVSFGTLPTSAERGLHPAQRGEQVRTRAGRRHAYVRMYMHLAMATAAGATYTRVLKLNCKLAIGFTAA